MALSPEPKSHVKDGSVHEEDGVQAPGEGEPEETMEGGSAVRAPGDLVCDEVDDDDEEWTLFDELSYHMNRHQWVPVVVLVLGFSLFFADAAWAWRTIGGAVIMAGLYPVITGVYRSPFGILLGWKARVRGLVSVAIGAVIAFLG